MGYLKDIHSNLDIQAFPGATFEIADGVPAAQCSEALLEGTGAQTWNAAARKLWDPDVFFPAGVVGKVCTITQSPTGNTGDFDITARAAHELTFAQDPGTSVEVHYNVHDGGEFILTRDAASFADFIHNAGYAYTIKGGKLYTNIPSEQLQEACSILFDPLT